MKSTKAASLLERESKTVDCSIGAGYIGGASATLPLVPIRPAYEQIADQLRRLVISGDLRPGQRLPSENNLAIQFGVGRTTVREALRSLASQKLVATRRGVNGGSFIITPDRDIICQYLEIGLGLLAGAERLSVEDLIEARLALEIPAVRYAAKRHTPEQLNAIESAILQGSKQNEEMHHAKFHVTILKASDNALLEVMTRPVFDVMRSRMVREAAPKIFWNQVLVEHERIIAAIRHRDADAAAEQMCIHINNLSSVYNNIDTALHSHSATITSKPTQSPTLCT